MPSPKMHVQTYARPSESVPATATFQSAWWWQARPLTDATEFVQATGEPQTPDVRFAR